MAGKKLPRRTMSIAKRGVKVAEDAADLDLVEGAIGNDDDRFTTQQLLLGFMLAILGTVALMYVATLMFNGPDTDYSMLPDGYREATGLATPAYDDEGQPPGSVVDVGQERSPFPEAQTRDPVILDVDCPDGTVQISTGTRPVDTVCVRGELVESYAYNVATPVPIVQHVTIIVDGATVTPTPTPTPTMTPEPEVTP